MNLREVKVRRRQLHIFHCVPNRIFAKKDNETRLMNQLRT